MHCRQCFDLSLDTGHNSIYRSVTNNKILPVEMDTFWAVGEPNNKDKSESVIALNKNLQINDVNPKNQYNFACIQNRPFVVKCKWKTIHSKRMIHNRRRRKRQLAALAIGGAAVLSQIFMDGELQNQIDNSIKVSK